MKKHSKLMKLSAAGIAAAMVVTGAVPNVPVINKLNAAVTAYAETSIKGSGTVSDPYQIGSAEDWNTFAGWINAGTNIDKYYRQTADISTVSTMVGTESNPFQGTYDGNGYTLDVALNVANSGGEGVRYVSPFQYTSGATIEYVKVTGSVTGGMHCSGLVGFVTNEATTIRSCEVTADITCNANPNSAYNVHFSGILGHGNGKANNITDCLFSGKINKTQSGNYAVGVIYGWDGNNATVENCLVYGSAANYDIAKGPTPTNCISQASGETGSLVEKLGSGWTTSDNMAIPIRRTLYSKTVTFKVVNGSWNDETSEDKTVTVIGEKGNPLNLTTDQIPEVGNNPNAGYKAGSWDVTPSTDTGITDDTTYTYTYEEKADKSKLEISISDAGTYYDSIKEDYADIAETLKTAIETAQAVVDDSEATQEQTDNAKTALDTAVQKAMDDVQLAKDKATFEEYKDTQKPVADTLAEDRDTSACKQLIEDAKSAIDALTYDEEKSLDENKAAVDTILEQLENDLTAQREADKQAVNDVIAKINAIGTVEYTDASKEKIDTARNAYDALDDVLKDDVINYRALEYAEELYNTLKEKSETEDALKAAEDALNAAEEKAEQAEQAKAEAEEAQKTAEEKAKQAEEAKADAEAAQKAAEDDAAKQKEAAEAAAIAQKAAEDEAAAQKAAAEAATEAQQAAEAEAQAQKEAAEKASAAQAEAEAKVKELEKDAEINAEELAAAKEEAATQKANAEKALEAQQNAEAEAAAQKEAAEKALEAQQKAEEEAAKQKEAAEKAIAEKDEAVAAKEAAETAQKTAEEKAAKAEEAKNAAETAQKTAEEKAKQAEEAKANAEAAQKAAEDDAAKQKEAAEAAAIAQKTAEDEAAAQKAAAEAATEAQQAAEAEAQAQKEAAEKASAAQAAAEAKVKELEKDAEANAEELAAAKAEAETQKANAEAALTAQQNAEAEAAAQKANADKALEAQKAAEAEAAAQKANADKAADAQKAAEEAAEKAAEEKAAAAKQVFEDAKINAKSVIDLLAKGIESEESQKLIDDAKAAIDALTYDETKTSSENGAPIDEIVKNFANDIAAQRETETPKAVKANAVENNGLLFTAGIDSLNYKEVGFIFEVNGKEVRRSTNTVYSSIDGSQFAVSDFDGAKYIYSFTIEDIADAGTEIKVTPYSIDLNGNEVKGETETYSLAQLSAGGEVVPMSVDINADTEESGAIALYGADVSESNETNTTEEIEETTDDPDKEEADVTNTEIVEVEEVLD